MFTSDTGKCSRNFQIKDTQNKQAKIQKADNERFRTKFYRLKEQFLNYVQANDQPNLWSKIMNYCKEKYNILHEHISNIHVSTSTRGNRFASEKLREFFILVSFHGRSVIELLKKTFAFPSWRSISTWKKDFLDKYKINFDGSEESLLQIVEAIYDGEMHDKRVVVAVDAVSVSPNISISSDGKVTGLIQLDHIEPSEALNVIRSPEDFGAFVEKYAHQAIRYFFVLYLCPLDRNYISIPICMIAQTSGNANRSITSKFDEVLQNLRSIGFDVIGEAYDGDPGWLSRAIAFAQEICKNVLEKPDLSLEDLAEISVHVSSGTYMYEDMLHLVKCDRYRKASGAALCPTLYDASPTITRDSFEEAGIPRWIIDNNKYTKMDDSLPLKFFTLDNIERLRKQERHDLAFSLLPSTLLIEAVLNENYSREERLSLLSFGFSIIYIYYIELQDYTSNKYAQPQSTSKAKGKGKCVTLYEKKYCSKYLSLCAALSVQISQKNAIDLGALGSHYLEHFFGHVRRVSKGDDSADMFISKCNDAIMKHIISKKLEINTHEVKRVSSSGVF